jgi:site-specific recombinase XerD
LLTWLGIIVNCPSVSGYREYVDHYRPILVGKTEAHLSLFLARNGKPLTQKSLLNLVTRITVRHTGKRLTVKLFRDLVAAHMLATRASLEDVAECLWHLDPYSTTMRYYVSGFNTSNGVGPLEDELDTLQLQ